MKILNLTQHNATPDQIKAGVIEPTPEDKEKIKRRITFVVLPNTWHLEDAAKAVTAYAKEYKVEKAMIGGAPYLMSALEQALRQRGIKPLYAFSRRVVEEKEVDGKVEKKVIFKHEGFVEPF